MIARAFIAGLAGTRLSPPELAFLREFQPWGLILFKRNIEYPVQVFDLVSEFRNAVGRAGAPVLIDQEGGRVQRLGPPHWPVYPPGAAFGALYDRDREAGRRFAWLTARLIAADLSVLGITVDCLPLADVPLDDADPVIGDRAYGKTPEKVAELARTVTDGLAAGGVLPVLKHIPGHGRATADSHKALPVVKADRVTLQRTDFAPFKALRDLPMAMTAHVVFTAYDQRLPATTSATMIGDVIRSLIGFRGLLMSDDISMNALSGTLSERTAASLAAGCDVVLHCNGNLEEMREVAGAAPLLSGVAAQRADAALAARHAAQPLDIVAARAEFAQFMDAGPGAQVAHA